MQVSEIEPNAGSMLDLRTGDSIPGLVIHTETGPGGAGWTGATVSPRDFPLLEQWVHRWTFPFGVQPRMRYEARKSINLPYCEHYSPDMEAYIRLSIPLPRPRSHFFPSFTTCLPQLSFFSPTN